MADSLDKVLDILQQAVPELTPERRLQGEIQVRAALGGSEFGYIARRPTLMRVSRMGQALQQGLPLGQVIAAENCHRATAYRILSRPLKRPR